MDDKAIIARINVLFRRSGMRQSDAAESLGISRNAFCNILYGKTKNFYKYLSPLAELFGVSEDALTHPELQGGEADGRLQDVHNYQMQIAQLTQDYETRLTELKKSLSEKEEHIADLKKLISMLERQLDQK